MKHCRKLLALVLVLASLLSLVLVADAADVQFTDARKITHGTAVDLLSAIGVINGYEDGSFKPQGNVTRAEMAKILAFVLNNGADVGESYTAACTFADSQNHWAKGYIGFCVSAGLINGKSPNTFDPNGQVTGYEVSKMLLCALGYKAELNGLTGPQWDATTHSLAIKTNLLPNLKNYTPANPLNRDDSCQMILNALHATMVECTGSVVEIDGITIVQDVQNTPLAQTGSDYAGRVDSYQQLVEEVFPSLRQVSGTTHDAYGRPAVEWKLNGKSLGVSIMTPVATSDTTLKANNVLKDMGNATVKSAEVFVNGETMGTVTVEQLTEMTGFSLSQIKTQKFTLTAAAIATKCGASLAGNNWKPEVKNFPATVLAQLLAGHTGNFSFCNGTDGSTSSRATYTYYTEAYFDAATGKFTLINNNFFYGKVTSLRNTVEDDEGNVIFPGYILVSPIKGYSFALPAPYADLEITENATISGGALLPISLDDVTVAEDQDDLKVGDYVVFNLGCADRNAQTLTYCAENARLMATTTVTVSRTSTLSANKGDGSLRKYDTVYGTDGNTYRPADDNGKRETHDAEATYDLIVAMFGTRYYYYQTNAATGKHMYLYNVGNNTNGLDASYEAKLVDPDGAVKIVTTDRFYLDLVGCIVTTTTNAAGQTVLTDAGSVLSANHGVHVSVTNSNSTVTFDDVTKIADTKTRFVISQVDSNGKETFTAYVGIHNVPDIKNGQYYAYVTGETGTLDTVFILNTTGVSASAQEGVIFKSSAKDAIRTDGKGTYYTLPAFVDGELTTVDVSTTAYANLVGNGFHLFSATTADSQGVITAFSKIAPTAIRQFTPAKAGVIYLNDTAMTYHDNVLVYTYSVATETLAESTVEALPELVYNAGFTSYYTLHESYPGTPLAAIFAIIP